MNVNDRVTCGNGEALVSYLYDECDLSERALIERHLASCQVCRQEVAALKGVRGRLAEWVAPNLDLGFQIVAAPRGARPARWSLTSRWALAAAAAMVLAAGAAVANMELRVGSDGVTLRTGWTRPSAPARAGTTERPWQADLVALEQTLRDELSRVRQPSAAQASAPERRPPETGDAVLRRVQALVEASERRQQEELALRVAQLTREIEANRQADLLQIRQGFGQLAGATGAEVARQRELMNYLIRVSQR